MTRKVLGRQSEHFLVSQEYDLYKDNLQLLCARGFHCLKKLHNQSSLKYTFDFPRVKARNQNLVLGLCNPE